MLGFDFVEQTIVVRSFENHFFDRELLCQLFLQADNFAADRVSEFDGFDHVFFGDFAREAFDHGYHLLGTRNDHIHVAVFKLLKGGESHQFAINSTDTGRGNRLLERQF